MNKQTQIETFNALVEKQRDVMLSKGDDYANEDRLSNFKTAGKICGLTAAQHCLAMIATKVARLGVLLNPNAPAPKHEAVEDSVLDLANYAQLLNMILVDEKPEKKCCGNWDENGVCSCGAKPTVEHYTAKSDIKFLENGEEKVCLEGEILNFSEASKIFYSMPEFRPSYNLTDYFYVDSI